MATEKKPGQAYGISAPDITAGRVGLLLKLSFLALFGFFIASIATNIVQAVQGSCSDLNKKVDRFEEENSDLERQLQELQSLENLLSANVSQLEEQNEIFEAHIQNLTSVKNDLSVRLADLEDVRQNLNEVLQEQQQTFEEFEEETEALYSLSNSLQEDLEETNVQLDDMVELLGATNDIISEETEKIKDYLNVLDETVEAKSLLDERDVLVSSVLELEFERDGLPGFNRAEYDFLVIQLAVSLFPNVDRETKQAEIEDEFPFTTDFDIDDARTMVNALSDIVVF